MRVFPLIAALLLTACETNNVRTDFDPAVPLASYRTYSWLPSEVPRGMNPLMFKRVKDAIDRSLAARGYTQASPADFAIAFTIGEKDRLRADDYGYGWGGWGGYGWGGWGGWGRYGWGGWGGWGPYYPHVDIYTVTERSIIIDIYDAKTQQPAWHGEVSRESYSGRVNYARLDQAVDKVLSQFPPQPGAKAY
jgi:hypothetical protein